MCIATTKKAAGQLQKILNKLGEFGGVIETDNPGAWWNLDVEIESISDDVLHIPWDQDAVPRMVNDVRLPRVLPLEDVEKMIETATEVRNLYESSLVILH